MNIKPRQNPHRRVYMPILVMALLALAAFGLIGIMLALAVTFEQKSAKHPHAGKVS